MGSFTIQDLSFTYPERDKPALSHVSMTIADGDFVVLCGRSGCGKSTLLRHLKTVLTPHGQREGAILFDGKPLQEADLRTQASQIGYVLQNPDNQIVTDKVWHELAFGLESLGFDTPTIRLRVAEMASFFGIEEWFLRDVSTLSGGQKQLLNLASIMAMQPGVLILDEPTSQLDPIAASEFLETVKKINRELGTTVIISEHRLDEIFPAADKAAVLDGGELLCYDTPARVGSRLGELQHPLFSAMPAPIRIFGAVEGGGDGCPLTVRDGRKWLAQRFPQEPKVRELPEAAPASAQEEVLRMKEVWFRYEKKSPDVLQGLSFAVHKGEWFSIVGGNGAGKTTALSLVSRANRPYRGKVFLLGREIGKYTDKELFSHCLGVLPQNPQSLFVKKTVELDLLEILSDQKLPEEEKHRRVREMAELVEIQDLLPRHPYDISGGEQQRAALAKVLLLEPSVLLLDEPTKGIDSYFKAKLAGILQKLKARGVTIIMVSHDVEFCAQYADTCAMFFNGSVVSSGSTKEFFSGNSFYTTSANRMARKLFPGAVTSEDVIELCQKNL